MQANEIIELYVTDTVRLLPKQQRVDVANELRALISDELNARASAEGRPADEELALSLIRSYGRPNVMAARYQPAAPIIDPADSMNFLRAAFIGSVALILLSALNRIDPKGTDRDPTGRIVSWMGCLVLAFGAKSWMWRRWPSLSLWKPCDRDRVNRIGTAIMIPFASLVVVLYAAPAWVLNLISGGRINTAWADYTADFVSLQLPLFIGCLVGLLMMAGYRAVKGRRTRMTRRVEIGLNLTLALLALVFAVNGNLFQSGSVDQIARSVMTAVASIYIPSVGVMIYGELGRIDLTPTAKTA